MCTVAGCNKRVARWRLKYFDLVFQLLNLLSNNSPILKNSYRKGTSSSSPVDHYESCAFSSVSEGRRCWAEVFLLQLQHEWFGRLQSTYNEASTIPGVIIAQKFTLKSCSAHETGIECPILDCSMRFLLADMDSHFATMHGGSTHEDCRHYTSRAFKVSSVK